LLLRAVELILGLFWKRLTFRPENDQ
jgi:hypothetical protein